MKKTIILLVFLLFITSVSAFDLPEIKSKLPSINVPKQTTYESYKPTIPTPPPFTIKICDERASRCQGNNLFICEKNSWKLKQECKFDEFCHNTNGCLKKQTAQPKINIVKPVPELKIVSDVLNIAQVCRKGDIRCSEKTNSVMVCQNNQWLLKQKCAENQDCITGKGCVEKVNVKFPDYSTTPTIPAPKKSPIDLGCNNVRDTTCMGKLFLVCKETQLGKIWTNAKDCGKPEFCNKKEGCILTKLRTVNISVKKSNVSKQELNDIIKDVEAQQETLRNKRQTALTAFQNFDQKANQLYNVISSVLKTMNEIRSSGTSSRSSALTSQERSEELSKSEEQAKDLREKLIQLIKESQKDSNEDKEYYLEKLEKYNKMGEQLSDYLSDLVDHSTELSEVSADESKSKKLIEYTQREIDDMIAELLKQVKQGNVDAVSQLLVLMSKKSQTEQERIAKKVISLLDDLEQKQKKLSEQLKGLNSDKSQSKRLSELNKEINSISTSRKSISNILRETMQTQEEVAETTKSILDKQGRITRQSSRFEVKDEKPKIKFTIDKKPTVINKAWNWIKTLFTDEEEAQPSEESSSTEQTVSREYPWCDDPDGNDVTRATTVTWQQHNWSWQESKQDVCTGYNLRKIYEATCGTYHEELLDCPENSICVSGACTPENQVEDREAVERDAWRNTGDERAREEYWGNYCLDYRSMDTDAPGIVTHRTCDANYNCSDLITLEESCSGNIALHYRCDMQGALGHLISSEQNCGEDAQCVVEPWGSSCRPRNSDENESCTRSTDWRGHNIITYKACADCEPVEYSDHCLEGNRVAKLSCLRNRPVDIVEECSRGLTCPINLTQNAINELGFPPRACGDYSRYENDRGPECTQTTEEDGSIIVSHKRCTNCPAQEYRDECSNNDVLVTFRCENNNIDYGAVDCRAQRMTCPRGASACQ